jgi:hypothetical protein
LSRSATGHGPRATATAGPPPPPPQATSHKPQAVMPLLLLLLRPWQVGVCGLQVGRRGPGDLVNRGPAGLQAAGLRAAGGPGRPGRPLGTGWWLAGGVRQTKDQQARGAEGHPTHAIRNTRHIQDPPPHEHEYPPPAASTKTKAARGSKSRAVAGFPGCRCRLLALPKAPRFLQNFLCLLVGLAARYGRR